MNNENICFICVDMALKSPAKHQHLHRDPKPRKTEECLLCARHFCEARKSNDELGEHVCEVNHRAYYANNRSIFRIYPTLQTRERLSGVVGL